MSRRIGDESGYRIEATFSTRMDANLHVVWIESRGGAIGDINERNRD